MWRLGWVFLLAVDASADCLTQLGYAQAPESALANGYVPDQHRWIFPGLKNTVTVDEAIQHLAEHLKNPFMAIRAGEILARLNRTVELSRHPRFAEFSPVLKQYEKLSSDSRGHVLGVNADGFTSEQKQVLNQLLTMARFSPQWKGNHLELRLPEPKDPFLEDRLKISFRLLEQKCGSGSCDQALGEFADLWTDIIVQRATVQEIADAPFLFRRWDPRVIDGHHALRGSTTHIFRDPYQRVRVIRIAARRNSNKKDVPEEIEVVQLAPREGAQGEPYMLTPRFLSRKGGNETTNPRACLACHFFAGGKFMIRSNARVLRGIPEGVPHPPREERDGAFAYTFSDDYMRENGVAVPVDPATLDWAH